MTPAIPGPAIVAAFVEMPRKTFPAGSRWSGKMLGIIAPTAGPPKASLTPIKTTIKPKIQNEIVAGSKKTTTLHITALKPSAAIITVRRGRRSAQTPPTGASRTPERMRAPRMIPKSVALPPASKMVIASAIGKAVIATTVRIVEINTARYDLLPRREPGAKYLLNISNRSHSLNQLCGRLGLSWCHYLIY